MADDDSGEKTEDPSSRKLDEARKQGQVATSREVGNLLGLAATGLVLMQVAPRIATDLSRVMTRLLTNSSLYTLDRNLGVMILQLLGEVGLLLALPVLALTAAGIAGPLMQNGFVVSLERLMPDISHLSPGSGFKRLVSMRNLVEFAKSLGKLGLVGAVVWMLLRPELARLPLLTQMEPMGMAVEIQGLVGRMMIGVIVVMAMLALFDYAYQRFSFRKSMRMTKEEVKDEYKQVEGDPRIKAKLRQIRVERARRRMMANVPKATVVLTNPTHFAVACRYEMGTMAAPVLVAKGADLVAKRIREVALAHGVPIVENPPLTRALYATVELDSEIPPEHYKAVAEVIGYVFRLQGKLRDRAAQGVPN